jgi:hypothetical protein
MIMSVAYTLDFFGVVYHITFNKRAVDLDPVIQCARACAVEVIAYLMYLHISYTY